MSRRDGPRCAWAERPRASEAMVTYHDTEWGVPSRDEVHLFELLVLESAQAGLSWSTILSKRDGYREAFSDFDVERVASYGPAEVEALIAHGPIVRNRAKIEATVANAGVVRSLHGRGESLADLLWSAVGGVPVVNHWTQLGDLPASTPEAAALSTRLKAGGFRFVGPTICYSLMQAAGLVNDHVTDCFRWTELGG